MEFITLFLIIIAIIIGFLIGKYITEQTTWGDKKRILDSEWKLKLDGLTNEYRNHVLELQKNSELNLKKLAHEWELKYTSDLAEIKEMLQSAEKYMRCDAIVRSRRTLLGKLWEQVCPYIPKFPFRPSDMKFLGAPIDFVIFDGASENDIKQVVFLEVKSGSSNLNSQERKLKDAIEKGNVSWKLFNIEKPEEIKIQEDEQKSEMDGEITPHEIHQTINEKINGVKNSHSGKDGEDTRIE